MSAHTPNSLPGHDLALPPELSPAIDKQLLIARIGQATLPSCVASVAPEITPAMGSVNGEVVLESIRHNIVATPDYQQNKMIPFSDDALTRQVADVLPRPADKLLHDRVGLLMRHVIGHDVIYGTRLAEHPGLLQDTASTYLAEVDRYAAENYRNPASRPLRYPKAHVDAIQKYFADDPIVTSYIVRDYIKSKADNPLEAILEYKQRYAKYRKQYPPTLVEEITFQRLCRYASSFEQNLADRVAGQFPRNLPVDNPGMALALLRKDMHLLTDFPQFSKPTVRSFIDQLAGDARFDALRAELGDGVYEKYAASALSLFGAYRTKTGENIHALPQLAREVTALFFEQTKVFTDMGAEKPHASAKIYAPGEDPPERARRQVGPPEMPPPQSLDTLLATVRAQLPEAEARPGITLETQARVLMEAIRGKHNENKHFLKGITSSKKYRPWYDAIREDMKQWDVTDSRGQKHLEAAQKRFAQFTAKHLAETDDAAILQRPILQQLFMHFWKDISMLVNAGITHMPYRLASYVAASDIAPRIKSHPRRQTAALMVAAWPAQAIERLDEYDAAHARLTKTYSDHRWVGPEIIDYCASLKDADAGMEMLLKRAEIIDLMFTDDPDFNDATVELLADNTWGCRDDATKIYDRIMEWKQRYHALRDEVVTQGIEADPYNIKYAATDASQTTKRLVGYVMHLEKKARVDSAWLTIKSCRRDEKQSEIDILPPASSAEDAYLKEVALQTDEEPAEKHLEINALLEGLSAPERQLVALAFNLPEAQSADAAVVCAELGIHPGDLQEHAHQALASLRQKTTALGSLSVSYA